MGAAGQSECESARTHRPVGRRGRGQAPPGLPGEGGCGALYGGLDLLGVAEELLHALDVQLEVLGLALGRPHVVLSQDALLRDGLPVEVPHP